MHTSLNRSAHLIEHLKTIDSPTLSNAIETLDLQRRDAGFTPLQVRCLFPELGRLCGYAVTAQVETVTGMHPTEEPPFLDLFKAVENSPQPAVVAFQEIGGHADPAGRGRRIAGRFAGRSKSHRRCRRRTGFIPAAYYFRIYQPVPPENHKETFCDYRKNKGP